MSYRRYPNHNKVLERDRIYLDDYVEQVRDDANIMIGSVGDSIKIYKDYNPKHSNIDHIGNVTSRGNHGG